MPPAIDFAAPSHEEPPRGGEAPFTEGPPLAQALVVSGHVSPSDMRRALAGHIEKGESLARYLLNQGLASEEDLVWAMAQEVGLEFIDLSTVSIDRTASMLIPEATARRHMVLPIEFDDGVPVVAMANPTDVFAMDDLRSIMGRNFRAVVATRSQITSFMNSAYGGGSSAADQAATQAVGERRDSGLELETLQAVVEDAPIVRYVNLLILQALNERASDIHIEPTEHRLRIRFRIDGVMHEATSASASIAASVVSRLKVLGEMDITEHRVPQEGRVSLSLGDRQLDLRLAVLPSVWGETVVMRILDKSSNLRSLPELGFLPSNLELYAKAYHQPYGVILVTGPTGAGKTTTLYATLKEVMTGDKAVVTVEDPVEYQLDGATQVQINTKAGLKFSTVLRSILRADPDIVLIGEIRDAETAMIAMEAALSGHLVLSTLHTNTAAATPLRLTEMGIEPFLVTSAVGSVLTQRLARKLCPKCKVAVPASVSDFIGAGYREADLVDVDTSVLYRAVGCRACGGNGYYGRMVLAEVMKMTEEINRLIITGGSIGDIERTAISQGMTTLRRDGLEKAIAGDTTLEEVLRVVV
jgi:type IV pilus assembly protein PilB